LKHKIREDIESWFPFACWDLAERGFFCADGFTSNGDNYDRARFIEYIWDELVSKFEGYGHNSKKDNVFYATKGYNPYIIEVHPNKKRGKWFHFVRYSEFAKYEIEKPWRFHDEWCIGGVCNTKKQACSLIEKNLYFPKEVKRNTIVSRKIITPSIRFNILKRDNYRCQICGENARDGSMLEIDHKIPKSEGGTSEDENLWTLCFKCNRGKGVKNL